ncbi:MAG: AMP-binding protein [Planctomycetota bacterium]|nr:AMP-binding protein [Planctomycetota bacterium]
MRLLKTIYSSWRRNALRNQIVDDYRSWRGIDLQICSWHIAKHINNTTQKQNIAILLPTSGMFSPSITAIWSLGKTAVPLNYLLSKDEINYIIQDSGVDTVIAVGPMIELIGGLSDDIKVIRIDEMSFKGFPPIRRSVKSDEEMLATILYTSGTSGKPKGVMLTAANLMANVDQCRKWIGFTKHDVFLGLLPQFHSFGFTVTSLVPAAAGARVIYTARFNPRKVLELLRKHNPTALLAIPSMFNAILNTKSSESDDFKSIKLAVSGGEALPDAVYEGFKERFGLSIHEGYGLTETAPVANICRPGEQRRGSVGMPVIDVHERIVDENENDLSANESGEIRITGPNIMRGYFNLPDETNAVFDSKGYFKTGDMGHLDEDGFLYITGRIKEMLIIGGENVFPREIEEVLTNHDDVLAAGVVGRKDVSRGEVAVAFVELCEGATFDEGKLRSWCRDKIATFKVPKTIIVLDALPRNPTGKIVRRELSLLVEKDEAS